MPYRPRIIRQITRLLHELGVDLTDRPFVIGPPGTRGVYCLTILDSETNPAGHAWAIVEDSDPDCSCDVATIVTVLETALADARDALAKRENAEHAGLN